MAASATSLSEALASGFLTCSVCLERLCRPKILPCLHTYCQACLEQLAGRSSGGGQELRCPECRELVSLPAPAGVGGLRDNFFVNGLLDLICPAGKAAPACSLSALVRHEQGSPATATAHCLDCADNLCPSCARGHRCSRLTHAHHVVPMEGYLAGRFDEEIRQRRALHCTEHPGEELRFFCSPCAAPLCRECRLGAHLQHPCLPLEAAVAARRPAVEGLLRGLEESAQRLAEGRARLAEGTAQLEAREAALRERAEAAGARLVEQLLAQRDEALARLSAYVQERAKAAEGLRSELEIQEQVASSTVAFARRVLSLGCQAEVLSLEETISERLRQLRAFSWQPLALPLPQLEIRAELHGEGGRLFRLELGEEAARRPGREAGAAAAEEAGERRKPQLPSGEGAQETHGAGGQDGGAEGACPSPGEPRARLLVPKPLFSCSFWVKTPNDKKRPQVTGLCPFGSGELLVADETNQRLKRFTLQGQFKGTVPVPTGVAPFSVAAMGSKVAFTSGSQLYLLNGEGGLVWQKALQQGQASHAVTCWGGDRVAVAVSGRLEVYDLAGRLVEKIVPQGSAERCLVFLASRKGGFVGSDWYRHSVVLFTKKGEVVAECQEEQLSSCQPGAVCADATGIVYVVLRELNKVVAFSQDGEALGPFLTAENSIDRPRVVTVTGDGRFVVALSSGTVHTFKIRYQGK